ncbi:MAG: 3-oxoacyl-ACP reductase [Deltaproteobacteria bacterium]|nr:MAG: 3-oxoacyl-ACP reductase [Deltaproteobacteria bacterium]
MTLEPIEGKWFLVLGASSGFGAAACRKMAKKGMNIFGVHLDRKSTMPMVNELIDELKAEGVQVHFFNINIADPVKRADTLDDMKEILGDKPGIRALLHSVAFGSLKPYVQSGNQVTQAQLDMTADVMAHSLVYWTQDLIERGMLANNSRIFAMTSSGSTRAMPSYGAVSAAKAALEAHIRQLAMELAPMGITANAILAGVTDTPALRKIPGNLEMLEMAAKRNPSGRLTTPEDVAEAIALFTQPGAYWITGNTIGVDGGENVVC